MFTMKKSRTRLLLIALCIVLQGQAAARMWTDNTGRYTVDAEFVELNSGVITLRKTGGDLIKIPLTRLSPDDQAFARTAAKESRADKPALKRPTYLIGDDLFQPLASHPGYEIASFNGEDFGTNNSSVLSAIAMPDGSFWVGGKDQLLRFDGKAWKRIQPVAKSLETHPNAPLTPYYMTLDQDQTLWFHLAGVSDGSGIYRYRAESGCRALSISKACE